MPVTAHEADLLRPEVIRNEVVEKVDQMERIQLSEGDGFASALNTFPIINVDDPDEAYYTFDGMVRRMQPVDGDSESPVGSLELPDKEDIDTQSYKEKFNPKKDADRRLGDNTVYSLFQRAVQKIQIKIYLTREIISWRGDEAIDGLIGQFGTSHHDAIPTGHVIDDGTAWSDSANATPVEELGHLAYRTTTNGFYGEGVPPRPTVYMGPSAMRDLKQTSDLEDRLTGVRIQSLDRSTIQEIVDEDIGNIRRVMVEVPRENENGELIDENDNVVDDPDAAASDNILEPYDPNAGEVVRNVVVGRAGPASAYFPWFLEDLTNTMNGVDIPGQLAIEQNEGFFVQRKGDWDPIGSWIKGAQELGFEVPRGENFGVIRGV
ncbi:hypothetical protein [Saliphagus sp. LR7]|uniref:hypothetical protein n=1 Tax=Saliphagus sp. LR7 TaxID=2282654 RepID=UPI000DF7A32D|nr:hypothetical protein [Saliphagus sp. LR7]